MNKHSQHGGLSARQKANQKIHEIFSSAPNLKQSMFLVCLAAILFSLSSCDKKTEDQDAKKVGKEHAAVEKDSLNNPNVNIKVNRRYDDKGNLIGFDSTYSSYYSNIKGDTLRMDSLMHSFDRYFDSNHSSFFDRQFNPLFFNDSMRYPDFFHKDFFMKRYELNDEYLRGTMKRMDSIKNRFFYEQSKKSKDQADL
jgi:hypothetical protein